MAKEKKNKAHTKTAPEFAVKNWPSVVTLVPFIVKVLSLLEACFDLISGSPLSMKIQTMGGKITENLGFESPLRKVNFFCSFFLSFSNSSHKSGYLLF